jgi:hypothetical protein
MKTNVEDDVKKLKDLMQPVLKGFSEAKKNYVNSILERIITELNFRDNRFVEFQSKAHKFKQPTDFLDKFEMYSDLFALCGCSDIDYIKLRKDCIDWMLEHSVELIKPFTLKQLFDVHEHLSIYRLIEERWPDNFKELKEYINTFVNQ